ncbi:PadR family transcriptional regulator, partial [Acidocella sp.]|uniref:PadR family transcriptional regulator n=1 Tax=Acidocella sp. TaxID=50710 RepID=UPI002630B922
GGGMHGPRHGRGGRMARLLEHGDLRLLVLHLINEKPRHGYEIIKAIEDLSGGAYAPSPGVIYPTLMMLDELGQVASAAEGSRKLFSITPEGKTSLTEAQPAVDSLLARIAAAQPREMAPPVIRAMENLRTALRLKLENTDRASGTIRRIADLLDSTARQIEDL